MSLDEFGEDLSKETVEVDKLRYLEAKVALLDHVFPLFESMREALEERFEEVESAVAAILEEAESMLQVPDANTLKTALQAAMQLAEKVKAGGDSTLYSEAAGVLEAVSAGLALVDELTLTEDDEEEGSSEEGDSDTTGTEDASDEDAA
jgi:hypothetical protein